MNGEHVDATLCTNCAARVSGWLSILVVMTTKKNTQMTSRRCLTSELLWFSHTFLFQQVNRWWCYRVELWPGGHDCVNHVNMNAEQGPRESSWSTHQKTWNKLFFCWKTWGGVRSERIVFSPQLLTFFYHWTRAFSSWHLPVLIHADECPPLEAYRRRDSNFR